MTYIALHTNYTKLESSDAACHGDLPIKSTDSDASSFIYISLLLHKANFPFNYDKVEISP